MMSRLVNRKTTAAGQEGLPRRLRALVLALVDVLLDVRLGDEMLRNRLASAPVGLALGREHGVLHHKAATPFKVGPDVCGERPVLDRLEAVLESHRLRRPSSG